MHVVTKENEQCAATQWNALLAFSCLIHHYEIMRYLIRVGFTNNTIQLYRRLGVLISLPLEEIFTYNNANMT